MATSSLSNLPYNKPVSLSFVHSQIFQLATPCSSISRVPLLLRRAPAARKMPDIRMLLVEPGSLEWFVRYMRLRDTGVIPTVTPSEFLPSGPAMAAFWGPKSANGWYFHDHGNPLYEIYARELLMRVLQTRWPLTGIMPVHFARGLMAEAMGVDVSWAQFAYGQTHPHQSPTSEVRILPQFRTLPAPLHRLTIVLPDHRIQVRPLLNFPSRIPTRGGEFVRTHL